MANRKVIKLDNLPTRLPLLSTLTTAIALDYWKAPQWLWGAMGLFFLIGWIVAIISIANEKHVDILENHNNGKSNWGSMDR